jgi:hypothetical protein
MLAITALDQSPGPRTGGSQSLSQPLPNFLVGSRRSNAVIQQPNFPVIPRMIGPPDFVVIGVHRKIEAPAQTWPWWFAKNGGV